MDFTQRAPYAYCSAQEALERQSNHDIDPLESTESTKVERRELRQHDPLKIIKKFHRSAVGEDMQSNYPSRSSHALYSCALYLCDLWNSNKTNSCNTYVFIMDRMRAIRQEIVVENLPSSTHQIVDILDATIRFYVQSWEDIIVSGMRSSTWFDEVLHERALSSCLASLISINADRNIAYVIYLNISHVLKHQLLPQYAASNNFNMHFPSLYLNDCVKYGRYLTEPKALKATKCICHLQQGNIDVTVRLLHADCDSIVRSLFTFHILPYLRLWRFLLIRSSINPKSEGTLLVTELAPRLYLTKSTLELMLHHSNIAIDASADTVNAVELKKVPVTDLLNSFLFVSSQGV